jgi:predicted RNA-binding Zn ribbon-like protein
MLGNRLCIDFANTIYSEQGHDDALMEWQDIPAFIRVAGLAAETTLDLISGRETEVAELSESLIRDGNAGLFDPHWLLTEAKQLRTHIRDGLVTLSEGQEAPASVVAALNGVLTSALLTEKLDPAAGGGWVLSTRSPAPSYTRVLALMARSAADVFVEGATAPVRKCGNPHCPLYFYDTSRAGRRRWCSMDSCGNRAKVAAFSRRAQHTSSSSKTV